MARIPDVNWDGLGNVVGSGIQDYIDYPANKIFKVTGQDPTESNVPKIQKYTPVHVFQSGVQMYLDGLGITNLQVVDPQWAQALSTAG
eukprot:8328163-Karenia_brevis.AAC.2